MIKVRCRAWWGLAYNTRWTHGLTRSQANAGALVGRKRNLKLGITTLGRFRGFREPRTPLTLLSFSSTQSLHFLSSANVLLSTKETHPCENGKAEGTYEGRCLHSSGADHGRDSVILEPAEAMATSWFLSFLSDMSKASSEGGLCCVVLKVTSKISALSLLYRYF